MNKPGTTKRLTGLLILYTAASLLHFTHNAEFLSSYPNLPTWISRAGVYVTWIGIAAIGALGYSLLRLGREASGLAVLALYACLGFDGLLHYHLAPFTAHSTAMNLTILFEVATAMMLLIDVLRRGFAHVHTRRA